MIVRPIPEGLQVTTQPDHAFLSAQLLELWRTDGVPEHPRREELLFAVREHDNGWREMDAAPSVDPATGRPHTFLTVPTEVRHEVWRRGVARFAEERPLAALLITEHALRLHEEHRGDELWGEFFEEMDTRRQTLFEAAGAEEAAVEEGYRLLRLTDLLSLAVCNGWLGRFERCGSVFQVADDSVGLTPFPFAGATTFQVRCRVIPNRPFEGDAELGGELAAARWGERPVRFTALETPE